MADRIARERIGPEACPDDVVQALERLVDEVIVTHHDRQSEESFVECRCCGGWEEHHDHCPMPAVGAWLTKAYDEPRRKE